MVALLRALLVLFLLCGNALAEKLDQLDHALDAYGDAYYKYEPMRVHYEELRALYNSAWKPVVDQQEVVRQRYAAWEAALAKFGKGTKEANDAYYAYKAESDKLGDLNRDAEKADPQHTATGPALDKYAAAMQPFKQSAESTLATVKAMFAEAHKIGKNKAQRDAINNELDKRLAAADARRAKQAAATRSSQADSVYPSSGTANGGNHDSGVNFTKGNAFHALQGGGGFQ